MSRYSRPSRQPQVLILARTVYAACGHEVVSRTVAAAGTAQPAPRQETGKCPACQAGGVRMVAASHGVDYAAEVAAALTAAGYPTAVDGPGYVRCRCSVSDEQPGIVAVRAMQKAAAAAMHRGEWVSSAALGEPDN